MGAHRLLVVEDDLVTSRAMKGVFEGNGWSVRTAATVAEAQRLLVQGPEPCCLVLDLDLPDGPGESVLKTVRALGLATYVAVCTGILDRQRLVALTALDADIVLNKPVNFTELWDGACRVCTEAASPAGTSDGSHGG